MQKSKYNITSRIFGSGEYYLVNLLTGNADILSESDYSYYLNDTIDELPELIEKGYHVDPVQEEKLYKEKYLSFIEDMESDEVQLFFVPGYACNFACSYCYQDEYAAPKTPFSREVIDAFFEYINEEFFDRKKYITVFGGEPFLNGNSHKQLIKYLFEQSKKHQIDVAVVTNGYHIEEYLEILKIPNVREVQVTLDGTHNVHDQRRYLKDGSGTFEKISKGVSLLLDHNIPVNLRVVVDKENFRNLSDLAQYAIDQGWTHSPFFKTQLGRNYELHHCQEKAKRLFTRIELYEALYSFIKENPHILEFHKPAFSISRFLFEEGELPEPLFDACPGTKTEWAFDYTGNIYSCTATVGKSDEVLGTFYPEVRLDYDAIGEWEGRDVLSIPECKECNMQLACGGGCGSLAKNLKGTVYAPDCRPITELISMGVGLYGQIEND